ncbi:MAG: DegT/DnrJ/EryC1/StrS family aminotransferase, partial [Vicinamibacterales bacterium]
VTRHPDLAAQVAKARAFGVDRSFAERAIPGMYDVPTLGLNYRLSDINAALGRGQLRRVGEMLERRRGNFAALKAGVTSLPGVAVLDADEADATNSHYCLSLVLDGALGPRRNEIVARLNAAGIGTSVYYPQPVPRMTYYATKYGYAADAYPEAARISDRSIALPVGPHLTADDAGYIVETLTSLIMEMHTS